MKKHLSILIIFLAFLVTASAAADSAVNVTPGITYMCGDSFEITIPDQPMTASQVTRASSVQAEAGPDERLMMVRVSFRNMTAAVYNGFTPDSFTLTGYVRDRAMNYTPVVFQSYDYAYGSSGSAVTSAGGLTMPPLREEDILLVFRVNPILINWELHFKPESQGELTYEFDNARYEEQNLAPCDGVLRFTSIRNAETGEITNYIRK